MLPPSSTSNVTSGAPTAIVAPAPAWSFTMRPAKAAGLVPPHRDARGDEPLADDGLLESLAEIRKGEHALAHQYAITVRAASAIRSTLGR